MGARGWVIAGFLLGIAGDLAVRAILGGGLIAQTVGAITMLLISVFILLVLIP